MAATAAVSAMVTDVAMAQNGRPASIGTSVAVHDLNIPPQGLASALVAFSRQVGVQIFVDQALASGKTSPGVSGALPASVALNRLLSGTGLTYRFTNTNTVAIERPGARMATGALPPGAISLDTIDVQGKQESAWGPVDGYVATRSATGTKTDTPLIETPQTIDVVTRDEIETRQAQTVTDALRYVAGVSVSGSESRRDYLNSRGFLASHYLNGLRLTDGSWGINQIDPYFLERIERVAGPASVLYGQASPGGIIEMVSKMPTTQPFHEVGIQTGSYGRAQGFFDFGGPVDHDGKLFYRLTGLGRTADTQVDFSKEERIAIAPALTWRPDVDTTFTILANYQKDPGLGTYYTLPSQGTVLPNPNGVIPTSRYIGDPGFNIYSRESASIGYMFERHMTDAWAVRQNLRYSYMDAKFGAVLGSGLNADLRTLNRYAMYDRDKLGQFTIDNQSQYKFDTGVLQHTALIGLDYQRTTLSQRYAFNYGVNGAPVPLFDIFAPTYYQNFTYPSASGPDYAGDDQNVLQQIGLYTQDQIKIGNLSIVGGLRQDWASSDTTDRLTGASQNIDHHALTGRVGAVYAFGNGISPYLSYSTSFQPLTELDRNGNPLKPTEGEQYEAGIKYQPPGSRSFVTASIFDLKQTNVKTPDPVVPTFSVQTGEVHAQGVELSAVASLADNFNLRASYTHLTAINSVTNDPTLLGKQVVGIPQDSGALWADYKFTSGVPAGFGIGGGVRYLGFTYGDSANTFKVPAATVFDAVISYDFGYANPALKGLQASLNASNLFDKIYVASCVSGNLCSYALRRQILATLSYRW